MPKPKAYVYLECVIWKNDKGEHHREDGPAWENANGTTYWYLNGQFHREDGAALEYPDGFKYWYLNGIEHTEKDYNDIIKTLR